MRVWRVHPPEQKLCPNGVLRWVLVWMSVCFLVFTVGPPSRSMVKKSASSQFSSCPPCDCFCSSAEYLLDPLGLVNGSIYGADCGKHDPVLNEEMNKGILKMLSEELNLQKIVANETLEHTKQLIMDARKTFSHYQKEAEKCNIGVETCEEARERAEAELIEEHKLTALWENRAREYGWVE
ncbi:hypothetical protein AAZX31_19G223500 [Glycine max]|uniref:Uncharacterized protein n=2 Tax=Glycine subgen. Soja TaxID=1462606 RepID=C6SY36_SOYBN|nr:uncharacterized protein LOC100306127 [Glycine max]XP_028217043.1 uncharacterized protein LOC114399127 isoform X1 [Glycine soja]ACU14159.1 unknown [Glycine max]KAG4396636.1 hypothetical protein GLYMA_19G238000v4 [Glycine max]KAG4913955.1 hypothetical protein JHK86_054388 [Glycine max]KAG4916889.1 hypothetical protein JHK87_054446 [Glycine soja]KAG4928857.1 hypothetical protein JHK85_055343 [Glycine max]|eukprot:NP_001237979.1 uncharacterized protein LOC100306127 [Glycine max]